MIAPLILHIQNKKKRVLTQDKNPTHRKIILRMNILKACLSLRPNVHQRTLHDRNKPGHGRQQQFCRSETPEENFLNKKCSILIGPIFLMKNQWRPQNDRDESKFIRLASVKYLIWDSHTLGSKSLYIEVYVLTSPQNFFKG